MRSDNEVLDQASFSKRSRTLVIGIDEAGYGPNLGALVIGCSAWIVETFPLDRDVDTAVASLLDKLAPVFLPKPLNPEWFNMAQSHIPLGDSKIIHAGRHVIDSLALGVLCWLQYIQPMPNRFDDVLTALAPESLMSLSKLPWYQSESDRQHFDELFERVRSAMTTSFVESMSNVVDVAGLRFLGLSAKIIDEASFNLGVAQHGNKASLLSYESLRLAERCLKEFTPKLDVSVKSIHVYCDKHGGRNRYQAPLMQVMPDRGSM